MPKDALYSTCVLDTSGFAKAAVVETLGMITGWQDTYRAALRAKGKLSPDFQNRIQ